jgi:hypothetical protein
MSICVHIPCLENKTVKKKEIETGSRIFGAIISAKKLGKSIAK